MWYTTSNSFAYWYVYDIGWFDFVSHMGNNRYRRSISSQYPLLAKGQSTGIIFIPYIGMYCNWLCDFLLASWLYYPIVGKYLRIYCTCDRSILGVGYTWRIN